MLGFSDSTTITFSIVGFFVLMALLVFLRLLIRRVEPTWRRLRVGFFVERDPDRGEREEER